MNSFVTGPRNKTALSLLGLTLEIKCDFTGKLPLLELYSLVKKCFLGKLIKTQLEAPLGDYQITANHLFNSDLMPSDIPDPSHSCEK